LIDSTLSSFRIHVQRSAVTIGKLIHII